MEEKWLLGIPVAALAAFAVYKHFTSKHKPVMLRRPTTRKGVPITPEMELEYKAETRNKVRMF